MSAVYHEGLEFGNELEHDIRNVRNYVMVLLTLGETLREDGIDSQDFMRVPKDLRDKRLSFNLRYHFACSQWLDPTLLYS